MVLWHRNLRLLVFFMNAWQKLEFSTDVCRYGMCISIFVTPMGTLWITNEYDMNAFSVRHEYAMTIAVCNYAFDLWLLQKGRTWTVAFFTPVLRLVYCFGWLLIVYSTSVVHNVLVFMSIWVCSNKLWEGGTVMVSEVIHLCMLSTTRFQYGLLIGGAQQGIRYYF